MKKDSILFNALTYSMFAVTSYSMFSVTACSVFNNNDQVAPPKHIGSSAMPIINQNSVNTNKTSSTAKTSTPTQRIQENKDYGGEVTEVKVNNKHAPDYYLYPNGDSVDTNAPSSDKVSTPSWKISW